MILIKSGGVIDPEWRIDEVQDAMLDSGMIKCAGNTGSPDPAGRGEEYERVVDATDLVAVSGLADVRAHSRDPGLIYKEDIGAGVKAVMTDGFTTVACMTDMKPPVDNVEMLSYAIEEGKKTSIHALVDTTTSMGMKGQELTDMAALKAAGAVGLTDDGIPMMNGQLVLEAMEETARLDIPLSFHEEDPAFIKSSGTSHGAMLERMDTYGSPSVMEDALVARDYIIILHTKAGANIQRMSSCHAVEMVRRAKAMGTSVVTEVTSYHFTLTEGTVLKHGTLTKMNPLPRTEEDRQALIQGLKDGTIDIIATDHAPYSQEEKAKPLAEAPSDVIGLETALALGITELVAKGYLTMLELMGEMSPNLTRPYRPLYGRLQEGVVADLVTFDEKELRTVENGYSKSANSPFTGRQLQGKVKYTIYSGKVVYEG